VSLKGIMAAVLSATEILVKTIAEASTNDFI
jgi:hypothetical protein